jgi:hypothetical protein
MNADRSLEFQPAAADRHAAEDIGRRLAPRRRR